MACFTAKAITDKHMKANELRLGNYVRVKDTGDMVRVCAITKRKIGFHYGNDKKRNLTYVPYSRVEPVLIAEVHYQLPAMKDFEWADKAMCEDLYYYKGIPIADLHELQNIHFAFTGNEIEIEI